VRAILAGIFLALTACSQGQAPSIGNKLVNPYSVASAVINNEQVFFTMSSAAIGEYESGNILTWGVDSLGKAVLRNAIAVPSYGMQLATDSSNTYLAAAFVGTKATILLYKIQSGVPIFAGSLGNLGEIYSFGSVSFFVDSGKSYLSFATNSNQFGGGVQVWNVSTPEQSTQVFKLPDDLSTATELNAFGYSNPVYIASERLFVAFPSNPGASASQFPVSAENYLAGAWDGLLGDVRPFSAVAIAMDLLSGNSSVNSSAVYVPLLSSAEGFSGSVSSPGYRAPVAFKTQFAGTLTPVSQTCKNVLGKSVLALDESSSNLIRLGGWEKLKTTWAAAFSAVGWKNKVAPGAVVAEALSSSSELNGVSAFSTYVSSLSFYENSAVCFPYWLRVEARMSGESQSRSWVQWNRLKSVAENSVATYRGDAVHNIEQVEFPSRGVVSAATASGFSSSNNYLGAVSFSYSRFLLMKYNSTSESFEWF
jgi:hypothetical protein